LNPLYVHLPSPEPKKLRLERPFTDLRDFKSCLSGVAVRHRTAQGELARYKALTVLAAAAAAAVGSS